MTSRNKFSVMACVFLLAIVQIIFQKEIHSQDTKLVLHSIDGKASFRGMSVVNDSVIWISGSKGTICKSTNGAKSFECIKVAEHDSSDFRSIYAFDENSALICKIGSPGKILKTTNGGRTWKEVYSNDDKQVFIDGIDFWNKKEGICFGDPINGKLMLIETKDGGETWHQLPPQSRPLLVEGESAFAASGTTIRCFDSGKVMIATGGDITRLLISKDKGGTWNSKLPPLIHGAPSTGIFSFDFFGNENGIAVGGDYKADSMSVDNIYITRDGGSSWLKPAQPTRGYRECVTMITEKFAVAVGPSGIDISKDGGITWKPFSDEKKFHVVRKSRIGNKIFLAGPGDKVGEIIIH